MIQKYISIWCTYAILNCTLSNVYEKVLQKQKLYKLCIRTQLEGPVFYWWSVEDSVKFQVTSLYPLLSYFIPALTTSHSTLYLFIYIDSESEIFSYYYLIKYIIIE